MGSEGANFCTTMGPRNTLKQELPKGIAERHGYATMVWTHITAIFA
jgi:hypothetical protein